MINVFKDGRESVWKYKECGIVEPIKRQRKESDPVYTIMLIPHKGRGPRSIHFRVSVLKKIGLVCGLLCLLGTGVVLKSSQTVYQAYQEQQELVAYRNEKAAQEQKIGKLLQENEAIEKEMAELSQLEEAVRRELGENTNQTSRSGIDRSQYLGQGGPQTPKVESVDIYAAQNKVLQEKIKDRKMTLDDLLGKLRETNRRKAARPDLWPTSGGTITSYFGGRSDPFGNRSYDWHPGIDIANDYGAPVYASASGTIQEAGWVSGYGRYVSIQHGYGYETAYGHMSEIVVRSGQDVKKGDVIGYVGSSGYSTGPHVHFEVLVNGQVTNPMESFR